jgi:hypothetical protein
MNATYAGRWQFSVRSLLLTLACCSLLFTVLPLLGVVAGSTAAMMLAVYLVVRFRPPRGQVWLVSIIGMLVLASMLIEVPLGSATGTPLEPIIVIVGIPVEATASIAYFPIEIASFSDEWWWYSRYHDLPRFIREEVVVFFWLQMLAAAAMAIVASQISRRRARRKGESEAHLIVPAKPSEVRSEAA